MSSRIEILSNIKANKPDLIPLPEINFELFHENNDILSTFKNMVVEVGGNVFSTSSNTDILSKVKALYPQARMKYSTLNESESFNTLVIEDIQKPHDLEDLDVLVLEGEIGVAENGAIWLSDKLIPIRALPFITKHLVLVIDQKKIVPTMHHAYELLADSDYNFGIFISGPSKTADIEQSLVIGAQGALSLDVFIK